MASRIADERGEVLGASVGFRVRFADQVTAATRIVLMTDGLLLAESSSDPELRRYDTIIVDEAHERSLNVDLLLGVLKRVLVLRPDLKVIVTSATLDVERISTFFGGAPIVTVSGRGYPIEVRYLPDPEDVEDPDLARAVLAGFAQISAEPGPIGKGDVLVFLPGEREIRDVGETLERELAGDVEVLPLYSRLSWDQQSKIFTARYKAPRRTRDQRRGDLYHGTGDTFGHRFRDGTREPLQPPQSVASACRSNRCRAPAPISARVAAADWGPGSACGSTRRSTSTLDPHSRNPKSYAPTSRPCCCASPPTAWAPRRTFLS